MKKVSSKFIVECHKETESRKAFMVSEGVCGVRFTFEPSITFLFSEKEQRYLGYKVDPKDIIYHNIMSSES